MLARSSQVTAAARALSTKQAIALAPERAHPIAIVPARRAHYRHQDWPQRARSAQATELVAARALSIGNSTGRSARAQHRKQHWPQRARSAQATAAECALIIGHKTGSSARAEQRPQHWPQRAGSSQASTGLSARALHRPQPQRARSAQVISTGPSARAHHRPQHWPQRALSSQATALAAARALITGHRTGSSARAQHWLHNI